MNVDLDLSGFWEFASEEPFWAWLICWGLWMIPAMIAAPFKAVFMFWNRLMRHRNIARHGWPTAPLMDADGDIVHPKPPIHKLTPKEKGTARDDRENAKRPDTSGRTRSICDPQL